ncbi:NADP-dependent oxidoreductase [Frondihabitans australicus]|uniref:NADPH:quinone reductase-like Zn-dependent oxidoreductase n=1 Tax=Frondihabitans australicus TaxID=386892 RepID=A0A495IH80_9MICO|nr:NADP-dependent oxidoreductase [Frondihabitans australicus]RKR75347.1 NADPH:quinone reductase-like Zn-dependent oxidoreductase [Frondihabitans australicus]
MDRTCKALEYDRYGDVDVLTLVEGPMPEPTADEVLVEVVAAGLNHIENSIRRGDFTERLPQDLPARQGSCFAGIVIKRGADVHDLHLGQAVIGHAVGGGAHATHLTVPRSQVVKKPDTVDWEVAGGLYLAGCTAVTIAESVGIEVGRTTSVDPRPVLVVSAAAGGVGSIECQLALGAGWKVIGTCSPHNHDYLRSIGVIPVTYGEGLEGRIRDAAARDVTAFIDNFGGDNPALARALGVADDRFSSSEDRLDVELRFITADADDRAPAHLLGMLAQMIAEMRLRVLVSGFYPFEYIDQAFADMAEMHSRGKVVVGMKPVESGSRSDWYLSGKARTLHEVLQPAGPGEWKGRTKQHVRRLGA